MILDFDRGTLLLREVPPDFDPRGLPGVLWDPRVEALRAPAWRLDEVLAALARADVAVTRRPRRHEEPAPGRLTPPALRPYQEEALRAWLAAGRRGVVVLPTGSGKTLVGIAAAARTGLRTLFLVPTRVLLAQWRERLAGSASLEVGCLGDGARDVRPLTVATFESAYRHMHRYGDRFGLLVVDEVHHFGGGGRDEALEMALAPARMGLTATPAQDEAASGRGTSCPRLDALIGPPVYCLGVGDLTGRYLAGFDLVTITVDLTPDERREYDLAREAFRGAFLPFRRQVPEATWADFIRAARRSEAGREALRAWHRSRRLLAYPQGKAAALRALLARHAAQTSLVFSADNETAYAVAREHLLWPITCDIGRAERARALEALARGEVRALVSARVLNEGLDVPDAEVGVVVGGTGGGSWGAREHVQRVGRLLRPGPDKRARVYELVVRDSAEARQAWERRSGLAARKPA